MFRLLGSSSVYACGVFAIWLNQIWWLIFQIYLFALSSSHHILCCAFKKSFHCMVCVLYFCLVSTEDWCGVFCLFCLDGSFLNQLKPMSNTKLVCFPPSIISFFLFHHLILTEYISCSVYISILNTAIYNIFQLPEINKGGNGTLPVYFTFSPSFLLLQVVFWSSFYIVRGRMFKICSGIPGNVFFILLH